MHLSACLQILPTLREKKMQLIHYVINNFLKNIKKKTQKFNVRRNVLKS